MERRKGERFHLEELAARLFLPAEGMRELDFSPINLSEHGISLWLREPLQKGLIVELELSSGRVPLRVLWHEPKAQDPSFYRVGFEACDKAVPLSELVLEDLSAEGEF